MTLAQHDRQFLSDHHSAAMITVARDGTPKVARVGVALVDGKLWSSGTQDRVRTKRLRRDPRCTLFVFDHPGWGWLALETIVTILDGSDAPMQSLQLFRVMQGRPTGPLMWFGGEMGEEQFLERMAEEQRLIYEFDVNRAYGMR